MVIAATEFEGLEIGINAVSDPCRSGEVHRCSCNRCDLPGGDQARSGGKIVFGWDLELVITDRQPGLWIEGLADGVVLLGVAADIEFPLVVAPHVAEPRVAADCFVPLFKREITGEAFGMALVEAIAHLNYLWHQKKLRRSLCEDGIWRFCAASPL